ncbi:MAG: hypothetical protein WC096_09170, partial [Sphaerochaetaceae bacterium]
WKGIQDYDEGTYWRSLSSELGLLDTNQQVKLGRFFREFIEVYDLLSVEIPGSQKNITPILLHGIIPRAQVTQFFDQIVYPLVRKELVNPRSQYELAFWLENKREAARRVEQLEVIQKKLKRLENAEKPMVEGKLSQLGHEIQQIEAQILQEEANLASLQAELDAIQYNPTVLTDLEKDLKTVQRLQEEYRQCLCELADQKHTLDETYREFQRYETLGIDDPIAIKDFDAFRHAAYIAIIAAVAAVLDNPEEPRLSGAQDLLTALCDSVSEGGISLPNDIIKQLETLRSTYETIEPDSRSIESIEDHFWIEEDSQAPTEPETVNDSEMEESDFSDKYLLPSDGETVPASDNIMGPEITFAHVRASDVTTSSPRLTFDQDSHGEDPTFLSRYAELYGMHLPDELPDDSDSGAGTLDQEAKDHTVPEVATVHPMDGQTPEQNDPSYHPILEPRALTGPEYLLPPVEETRADDDHGARQALTDDIDTPAATFDGDASSQPCKQEASHDQPEELEVQVPLEPEAPLPPLEPEPLTRYAEDTLQPMSRMRESTPRTGTLRSRQSLQAGSQTAGVISTLIDAIIDTISQFLRNFRR